MVTLLISLIFENHSSDALHNPHHFQVHDSSIRSTDSLLLVEGVKETAQESNIMDITLAWLKDKGGSRGSR